MHKQRRHMKGKSMQCPRCGNEIVTSICPRCNFVVTPLSNQPGQSSLLEFTFPPGLSTERPQKNGREQKWPPTATDFPFTSNSMASRPGTHNTLTGFPTPSAPLFQTKLDGLEPPLQNNRYNPPGPVRSQHPFTQSETIVPRDL